MGGPAPGTHWWPLTRARARVLCHVPAQDTCGLRDSALRAIPPRGSRCVEELAVDGTGPGPGPGLFGGCARPSQRRKGHPHGGFARFSAGLQDSGYDLGVTLLPDLHVNGGQGVSRDRGSIRHTRSGVRTAAGLSATTQDQRREEQGGREGQWPPEATAASGIDLGASRSQRPRFSARAPNAQRDSLGHGPEAGQGGRRSLGSTPLAPLRSAEKPVFQQHWSRPGCGALTWHLGNP